MYLLETIFYQPFFNLLILYYTLLEEIPGFFPDMGMAVILLTLTIRVLLLPLSLATTRSKKERRQIELAIIEAQKTSASSTHARDKVRKIFGANRRILISEGVSFVIQMFIFFILYRIFTTGLKGEDIHLVYSFMPEYHFPFNLLFLGQIDLTQPSLLLNGLQTLVILAVEIASLINSPYPVSRNELVRYVFILPIASFFLFMYLPSGKKLFMITTLLFSLVFITTNILTRWFMDLFDRMDQTSADQIAKAATTETAPLGIQKD